MKLAFFLTLIIAVGAGGFFLFRSTLFRSSNTIHWQTGNPLTHEPVSLDLEINNPDDQTLVFDKNLSVSGKTSPNAAVIISDDGGDVETDASKTGDFSQVLDLDLGLNTIKIVSFDSLGNSKEVDRTIYYSSDQI